VSFQRTTAEEKVSNGEDKGRRQNERREGSRRGEGKKYHMCCHTVVFSILEEFPRFRKSELLNHVRININIRVCNGRPRRRGKVKGGRGEQGQAKGNEEVKRGRREERGRQQLPCLPRGSWFTAMTSLFNKISFAHAAIFRRSLDMSRGAATIAQIDIWV
jgi:hypothetical protein